MQTANKFCDVSPVKLDPYPRLDRRYSSNEIAKVYGVSPRTVVQWMKNGTLEAMKIGKQWFSTAEALKEMERRSKI